MESMLDRRIAAVRRHAGRPLLFVFVVALLAVGISFILPKWYRARTTLLPPQEGTTPYGALASLIESSALGKVGLVATSSPSDVYVEILRSRIVREAVIKRFDLQRRFKQENIDLCIRDLSDRYKVGVMQSRAIELTVEDPDPKLAAEIANEFIAQLDTVNIRIQQEKARRTGDFLQTQMSAVGRQLRTADSRLADYERTHGVFTGSEASGVAGMADLVSTRLALQVRRTWLASYSSEDSPALKTIDAELAAIDQNVSKLPGLKQEGARLALEVEVQRRVYTLLMAQVEEAHMRAQGSLSTVAVLDAARAPTVHARPRKSVIVAVSTGIALLIAAFYVVERARRDTAEPGLRGG
jgi:tyrosine-protein kinase Etk/Wzc